MARIRSSSKVTERSVTFYGHLTGYSSYPVVSKQIAAYLGRELPKHGVRFRVCNLRPGPPEPPNDTLEQVPHEVRERIAEIVKRDTPEPLRAVEAKGIGLVFGWPVWARTCPRHEVQVGYHTCETTAIPEVWKDPIRTEDITVVPSAWCGDVLCDVLDLRSSVHVIHHGIDPEVFRPEPLSDGLINGIPVLLHFNSDRLEISQRKGSDALFDGIHTGEQILVQQFEPLEALMPGEKPKAVLPFALLGRVHDPLSVEVLNEIAKARGERPPWWQTIPPEEGMEEMVPQAMAAWLRLATGLVAPSRAEGFGMMPLEAAACGIPVVMTGTTGHAEYVDQLPGAIVVPTGPLDTCYPGGEAPSLRPSDVWAGLSKLLAHRDRYRKAALEASPAIREHWAWSKVLEPLRDLLLAELPQTC